MPETILITGANRGIGLALVQRYLKTTDALVIATARVPADAATLSSLGKMYPKRLQVLPLDVTDPESVAAVAAQLATLDVIINNAGTFPEEGYEAFAELDLAHFRSAFETNVIGVARVVQTLMPTLKRSANPRLVNISSGAGSISQKDDFHYYCYSVSKAALNMLTRALSQEYSNVVVVAISPGWVRTEMGGSNAPLSPDESARDLVNTIEGLSTADSGTFIGRDGNTEDYRW